MTSTVDANVLLYASDQNSRRGPAANAFLRRWAAGPELVYLFWPVALAYLRISTDSRVFAVPLHPREARRNISALVVLPHVRTAGEGEGFWAILDRTLVEGDARGSLVSDAHLVALMHQHGVDTIWTADRDFRRFVRIRPRDPFAAPDHG